MSDIASAVGAGAMLTKIDLYDNQIDAIDGLQACEALEELDLSHNRIHRIQGLDACRRLRSLYLVSNRLTRIENLSQLTSLELLELGDNKIRVCLALCFVPTSSPWILILIDLTYEVCFQHEMQTS